MTATLRSEMARMAARCGLHEPWAFISSGSGVGSCSKTEADTIGGLWTQDPERGTGRTTRIILLALLAVEAGHRVRFTASTLRSSDWITKRARELAAQAGLITGRFRTDKIRAPISTARLTEAEQGNHDPNRILTFRDHSYLQTLVRP